MRPGSRLGLLALLAVLPGGCSQCGQGDACVILAADAATPVLIPVAAAAMPFRLAAAAFDPVYPAVAQPAGVAPDLAVAGDRRIDAPIDLAGLAVAGDGTVTGFGPGGETVVCAPGKPCVPAAGRPPGWPDCRFVSPSGTICLVNDRQGRRLTTVPPPGAAAEVIATIALPRHFGGFPTVSDRGEAFLPAAHGFDIVDRTGVRHLDPGGPATVAAGRVGVGTMLVQLVGDRAGGTPLVLRLLDGDGRIVAAAELQQRAPFVFGFQLSRNGTWCAVTRSPSGQRRALVDLVRIDGGGLRLAATIASPSLIPNLAFDPDGRMLAVLATGSNDRHRQRRVSVFRLGG